MFISSILIYKLKADQHSQNYVLLAGVINIWNILNYLLNYILHEVIVLYILNLNILFYICITKGLFLC